MDNRLQLNLGKCKELLIYFGRTANSFPGVRISDVQLEVVEHAKILGLTISGNLKWNEHVSDIIKKDNKRFYFIVQLKRAKVSTSDIISFYSTCIRPVLEYGCQVFHYALPVHLSDAIERVQKRVLSIIHPNMSCVDNLDLCGLATLCRRREDACKNIFSQIVSNPERNLAHLLPPEINECYNLRGTRKFVTSCIKTDRFFIPFIPSSIDAEHRRK